MVRIPLKELLDLIPVEGWEESSKVNSEDLGYSAWYPLEGEGTTNSKRFSTKSLGTDFANAGTGNKILVHVKLRIFNKSK